MTDPLQNWVRGEPLNFRADTLNAWNDAARAHKNSKGASGDASVLDEIVPSITVIVRNDTGADLPVRSVVCLSDWIISPVSFPFDVVDRPILKAIAPTATTNVIGILRDAIPDGEMGRAIVSGAAVVDIFVNDVTHTFAVPIVADSTKMNSATSGPARIIKWETSGATRRAIVLLVDAGATGGSGVDLTGASGSVAGATAINFPGFTISGTPSAAVATAPTPTITVREEDGTPSVACSTLRFPNTSLTDNGGGSVSVNLADTAVAGLISANTQTISGAKTWTTAAQFDGQVGFGVASSVTGRVNFKNSSNANVFSIEAPAAAAQILQLPTALPAAVNYFPVVNTLSGTTVATEWSRLLAGTATYTSQATVSTFSPWLTLKLTDDLFVIRDGTSFPLIDLKSGSTNTVLWTASGGARPAWTGSPQLSGDLTVDGFIKGGKSLRLYNAITPTQITANQDDYSVANLDSTFCLRLSTDASRNLTGIVAQASGTILCLENVGSYNLVLKHEYTGSGAANRFKLSGNADLTMLPGMIVILRYDSDSSRWYCCGSAGGVGALVQKQRYESGGVLTGTATIPLDDTVPQSSEGFEVYTQAITPTQAGNLLHIRAQVIISGTVGGYFTVALFQDATSNALATSVIHNGNATTMREIVLDWWVTAASTSSTTFKIRAGCHTASTVTINGVSGSRYYGGVLNSFLEITEHGLGGSSGGTVTSFSAGDLSPLFTTSETSVTTTPALSFTLSNAAAYTVFGNNTSGSAAPAYVSISPSMLPVGATGWGGYRHVATDCYYPSGTRNSWTTNLSGTEYTAASDGVYIAVPYMEELGGTADRIGIQIGMAAITGGSLARLGIYDTTSTTNVTPNALIVDAGTVAVTSTGFVEATISQVLTKGVLYWLVARFDNAAGKVPTLAGFAASSGATNAIPEIHGVNSSDRKGANASWFMGYKKTGQGALAALASTFPSSPTAVFRDAATPVIYLRYSA